MEKKDNSWFLCNIIKTKTKKTVYSGFNLGRVCEVPVQPLHVSMQMQLIYVLHFKKCRSLLYLVA